MPERNLTDQAKTRLRRIEGQVRGIHGMLERTTAGSDGEPCDSLLTQILAVRAAVEQVGLLIMELHLQRCVLGDLPMDDQRLRDLHDSLKLWARLTSMR
jgi:DNA-binding FrmR family transcriptional regulator